MQRNPLPIVTLTQDDLVYSENENIRGLVEKYDFFTLTKPEEDVNKYQFIGDVRRYYPEKFASQESSCGQIKFDLFGVEYFLNKLDANGKRQNRDYDSLLELIANSYEQHIEELKLARDLPDLDAQSARDLAESDLNMILLSYDQGTSTPGTHATDSALLHKHTVVDENTDINVRPIVDRKVDITISFIPQVKVVTAESMIVKYQDGSVVAEMPNACVTVFEAKEYPKEVDSKFRKVLSEHFEKLNASQNKYLALERDLLAKANVELENTELSQTERYEVEKEKVTCMRKIDSLTRKINQCKNDLQSLQEEKSGFLPKKMLSFESVTATPLAGAMFIRKAAPEFTQTEFPGQYTAGKALDTYNVFNTKIRNSTSRARNWRILAFILGITLIGIPLAILCERMARNEDWIVEQSKGKLSQRPTAAEWADPLGNDFNSSSHDGEQNALLGNDPSRNPYRQPRFRRNAHSLEARKRTVSQETRVLEQPPQATVKSEPVVEQQPGLARESEQGRSQRRN